MLPKLILSVVSFLPLFFIMIISYLYSYCFVEKNNFILVVIIILFLICIASVLKVLKYIRDKESDEIVENEITFTDIKEDKKAHVDYMLTYLLPLLTFDIDRIDLFNIVYSNIFIAVFVWLNARSENFNINILLWLKGYSVYIGKNNCGEEKTLLIKNKRFSNLRKNHSKYRFVSFGSNDIYLCRRYLD